MKNQINQRLVSLGPAVLLQTQVGSYNSVASRDVEGCIFDDSGPLCAIVVCRDTVVVHSYHIAFRAIPLSLHTLDALATHQKY